MSSVFDIARKNMVDSQLRPNKVTDARLLSAMGSLPREAFLPASLAARAYADENIRLGNARFMLAPMALARLAQESALEAGQRVLIIGAGTGYGAAVLAATGAAVTALESDTALIETAKAALAAHAPGVKLVAGPLSAGWSAGAPYDCIFIEGGVVALPAAITAQLSSNGRVVMVQDHGPRIGVAAVGIRSGSALSFATKFDCVASVLPGFAPEPAFVF